MRHPDTMRDHVVRQISALHAFVPAVHNSGFGGAEGVLPPTARQAVGGNTPSGHACSTCTHLLRPAPVVSTPLVVAAHGTAAPATP